MLLASARLPARNVERDGQAQARLVEMGWAVLTVWECQTRNPEYLSSVIADFLRQSPIFS
jgi:DNA mismatch endonuclease (patch repair protein)